MPKAKESTRGPVGDEEASNALTLLTQEEALGPEDAESDAKAILEQIANGLPADLWEHISTADEAIREKDWDRALSHYDTAVKVLLDHPQDVTFEASAVSQLYLKRGLARFRQAHHSLAWPSPLADIRVASEVTDLEPAAPSADRVVEQTKSKPTTPSMETPVAEVSEPGHTQQDINSTLEEAARPRLRLPRVLIRGGQKQDEPTLSGGVGVIMLTEVNVGEREYAAKNWEAAIRHFDMALSSLERPDPDWSYARGLARVYFKRGVARFSLAQEDSDWRSDEPLNDDDDITIETVRSALHDFGEAIYFDPDWASSYGRRGEAHLFLARCHYAAMRRKEASKELKDALEDLTSAAERDPTAATGFVLRAIVYALLDDEVESEADVDRAVSLGARTATLHSAIRGAKSWRK
jgi:tetratricopeptide (TPR) repeat protein